ncbi:MAG: HEAT repeat domain-containing protein [Desulfosalsimonadaceae bacterium]|nr:HEAT repeat domain-containing protein [Desulfosalsimonadaceae bacterium]
MKRLLTIVMISLLALSAPGALLAKTSVQQLKEPVRNMAEYDLVFGEILDQGNAVVPDLMALLQEEAPASNTDAAKKHWAAKVTAMNILSELKAQDALVILKDMLENSDDLSAINNAARTIGNIGGNNAFKILESVLINAAASRYADNNAERKKAVILAMGLCENKKAIRYLMGELNDPNNDEVTRIYAAGSLGLLGGKDGLETAAGGLNSADPYVRMAAIRALGVIGSANSLPSLKGLTGNDVDYVYRKSANAAIFQIKTAQLPDDKKPAFIRQNLMENPGSTEFVQWGTLKLKKLGTPAAKKALLEMAALDDPDYGVLKSAAKARAKRMK